MYSLGDSLRNSIGWGLSALAASILLGPASASAETMFEALALTYVQNPQLRAARAQVRATDEGVPQALSGWRPNLAATGSLGKEESRSTTTNEQSLTPRVTQLDLTQPLYRGGRTVSATNSAESQVQAARATLTSTEQQVLLAAVTTYMDVLRDGARVQLTANNEQVLRRQLEATQDRFDVGEVTRTDVAQAEARLSRAVSDRVSAEGDLATSRATYVRVVGQAPGTLEPAPPLPIMPASLDEAMAIATDENPDLKTAQFTERAASHDVRTAFGSLLPTLNLVGQVQRTDEQSLENISSRSDSLLAQLSIPLYQQGTAHSQVRQAKQVRNQRRLEVAQSMRQVNEAVTQAWETLKTAEAVIASRRQQVRANEIALEGVRQEAAVGSRTTLDVLDAEQELLDSRVALVIAERDEYVAGFTLISAIGRLTAIQLDLPVELYDPQVHYQQVRDKWFGIAAPGLDGQ